MSEYKKNRRKEYYIDKGFQAKFIVKFCLLIVSASLLTGILIYLFNRQTTTVAFENLKVVVKSTSDFILPIVLQILVIVTLLIGIATIAITLFTSHKISGPLYRINIELKKIRSGDFSSVVHVRAKDQLKKVASELDEMRLEFKDSINTVKKNWVSVKADLQKLQKSSKNENEKIRITDSIEKIDSELSRFKID
jgi:methyl-accepting chemotaxis protein